MSDLIVCQSLLNSGSLSTGGPEVSRSYQGRLSSGVSSRDRQAEVLVEVGWNGGRKKAGTVVRLPFPGYVTHWLLAAWYLLPNAAVGQRQ